MNGSGVPNPVAAECALHIGYGGHSHQSLILVPPAGDQLSVGIILGLRLSGVDVLSASRQGRVIPQIGDKALPVLIEPLKSSAPKACVPIGNSRQKQPEQRKPSEPIP